MFTVSFLRHAKAHCAVADVVLPDNEGGASRCFSCIEAGALRQEFKPTFHKTGCSPIHCQPWNVIYGKVRTSCALMQGPPHCCDFVATLSGISAPLHTYVWRIYRTPLHQHPKYPLQPSIALLCSRRKEAACALTLLCLCTCALVRGERRWRSHLYLRTRHSWPTLHRRTSTVLCRGCQDRKGAVEQDSRGLA